LDLLVDWSWDEWLGGRRFDTLAGLSREQMALNQFALPITFSKRLDNQSSRPAAEEHGLKSTLMTHRLSVVTRSTTSWPSGASEDG
jgi:hypothetical protein